MRILALLAVCAALLHTSCTSARLGSVALNAPRIDPQTGAVSIGLIYTPPAKTPLTLFPDADSAPIIDYTPDGKAPGDVSPDDLPDGY